jgi:hypothetical protein
MRDGSGGNNVVRVQEASCRRLLYIHLHRPLRILLRHREQHYWYYCYIEFMQGCSVFGHEQLDELSESAKLFARVLARAPYIYFSNS